MVRDRDKWRRRIPQAHAEVCGRCGLDLRRVGYVDKSAQVLQR